MASDGGIATRIKFINSHINNIIKWNTHRCFRAALLQRKLNYYSFICATAQSLFAYTPFCCCPNRCESESEFLCFSLWPFRCVVFIADAFVVIRRCRRCPLFIDHTNIRMVLDPAHKSYQYHMNLCICFRLEFYFSSFDAQIFNFIRAISKKQ